MGKEVTVKIGCGKLVFAAAALAVYYSIIPGQNDEPADQKYKVPKTVNVTQANFTDINGLEKMVGNEGKEVKIYTDSIDFDKHFTIKTNNYTLEKDDDWFISEAIGTVMSMPVKLFFWDWDYGAGMDKEKSKEALAILENNDIKDITVRLNHNKVWKDLGRLFTDDKVVERNPLLARVFMGVPTVLFGEMFAELSRGAYYNPMTQTAVNYANIEAVFSHEIGHHKDFQRFDIDWVYQLTRVLPPVMLYQEWVASKNAESMMAPKDKDQFWRYLIPAFATYCAAIYNRGKKALKQIS